uniref:Uncharacterized protein n=1 Tax=Anguilla anguilla TaxID=7936 RepID=A0A0E9QLR7_ANGAN
MRSCVSSTADLEEPRRFSTVRCLLPNVWSLQSLRFPPQTAAELTEQSRRKTSHTRL